MTNEQAKQKAIQNAYGDYLYSICEKWIHHDNGSAFLTKENLDWLNLSIDDFPTDKFISYKSGRNNIFTPRSIQGIEDNNGWTRIETVDDLPKKNGEYVFLHRNSEDTNILHLFPKKNGYDTACVDNFSHWANKRKPPIY